MGAIRYVTCNLEKQIIYNSISHIDKLNFVEQPLNQMAKYKLFKN